MREQSSLLDFKEKSTEFDVIIQDVVGGPRIHHIVAKEPEESNIPEELHVKKTKRSYELYGKIKIFGGKKQKDIALEHLLTIEGLKDMSESEARLKIQKKIDDHRLKATFLYGGNGVWSKKKIIRNLKRIVKAGVLYDADKPKFIPIGSMLRMPTIGKTILSKYFYDFLNLCCGSIAHYNIRGWVAVYPTVEDLKQFFKKNEFGQRVLDQIPHWNTDVKLIVEEIEKILEI